MTDENTDFFIPRIETRNALSKGVQQYIIRGYAATAGNIYPYKKVSEDGSGAIPIRTFKEFFTDKAIESIARKAKSENIWVDYGHSVAFGSNIKKALENIESRSGLNLSEEKDYVKDVLKVGDIPMFKLDEIKIDDTGLFVEIHANPFYREVDEQHKKYFDSVWNSLENGFINGMSLNMKPTEIVKVNDELNQINDVDVFGISLLSGASNDMANITEVAMRCVQNVRGEATCPKISQTTSLLM